jgi:hypothetical protein
MQADKVQKVSINFSGFIWITLIICTLTSVKLAGQVESVPYRWKNVQMSGGGFVDGIVFHPTAKGVCYCRTDMGGAYVRNPRTLRWEPLLDWLSYEDTNLMGVESIALDPNDPDRVYLACGTYSNPRAPNGAILRSDDRGKTFHRADVPFKMGANEDGRGNGERLSVDPNDGNILYMGTRNAGLWRSGDRSLSWEKVQDFPDMAEAVPVTGVVRDTSRRFQMPVSGCGIVFTLFDPRSGTPGKGSSTIYAGVSLINRENLFRSSDRGKTWQPLPGQPARYRPVHAVLASDGNLLVTYGSSPGPSPMVDGGVWKFNTLTSEWIEITPDKPDQDKRGFGYAGLAVQSGNPEVIMVSTFNRYGDKGGEEIFRTTDGGHTWKPVFASGGKFDYAKAPYIKHTGIHWLFDVEIDPANPDHALFTTGYGGHETFNLTRIDRNKPTVWEAMATGIEESVALELLSPEKGARVITAIGDYGGFVHYNPDKPSPEGNFDHPRFGNTNSVACAENHPEIIVRVGRATNDNPGQHIGFSTNGGKSWQPVDSMPHPQASLGRIAVSCDGKTWIWSPEPLRGNRIGQGPPTAGRPRQPQVLPVYMTSDRGKTWSECEGLPGNTRVIYDRLNPLKCYAIDLPGGKLYLSSDGGHHFTSIKLNLPGKLPEQGANRGDRRGGQDWIYSTPAKEGDLWIAAFDGLYHSEDAGISFSKTEKVSQIHGFGFGKEAPGMTCASLYLIGTINGIRGIFRSGDEAQSWVRINDDLHQWGLLLHVTGDPKKYGRVYVGTHGRGTMVGDPAIDK